MTTAQAHVLAGQPARAVALLERARAEPSASVTDTIGIEQGIARAHRAAERYEDALTGLHRARQLAAPVVDTRSHELAGIDLDLATALRGLGYVDDAEQRARAAYATMHETVGSRAHALVPFVRELAAVHLAAVRPRAAIRVVREALEALDAEVTVASQLRAQLLFQLAQAHADIGDQAHARRLARQALEVGGPAPFGANGFVLGVGQSLLQGAD